MFIKTAKNVKLSIALVLIFSIATSMILLPTADAHDPAWQIPTFAYVQPVIDPVGVGQSTFIYMWIDKTFGSTTAMTNDWRFHNFKLTITKPDNTTEVKTWDVVWDTTSSQGYSFTPDQVGTYQFLFEFPGQVYTQYSHNPDSNYVNDTFLPSSATATLTVQEEPIPYLPDNPLPTEYWSRPIYGENPNWWSISSNWLGSGSPQFGNWRCYVPDGLGSSTSHVMWVKPIQLSGGVVGGDQFEIQGDTFFEGSAYINRFVNPIVMDGKLYYKEPISFGSADGGPEKCVDLVTGEVIWSNADMPKPSFGMIYPVHNPQQHGVTAPMLVATTRSGDWYGYDADTGAWLWNLTGVPSGSKAMGPNGEYIQYVMENAGNSSNPNWNLGQWNSTRLTMSWGTGIRPTWTGEFEANVPAAYDWNISIPWRNSMPNNPSVIGAFYGDMLLCYNGTLPNSGFTGFGGNPVIQDPYTYFAVNLNSSKGAVGSIIWMKNFTPLVANITVIPGGIDPVNGVYIEKLKETNQWAAINMRTGERMWGPVGDQLDLDYYGNPGHERVYSHVAYGKVYSSGYSGVIYCYDEMSGNLLWTYGNGEGSNSTNSGFAVPGHYPTAINAIGNGIIYTVTTEHTIQTPIYKGSMARAINATDGTLIWAISANTAEFNEMAYAIADGYSVFFNGYDNQIYTVGRGPSATTVSAPNLAPTMGQSIVLTGTVTDISAGTQLSTQQARFPNGVACAADESMSDWMGYVYQQKALPTNFMGVDVTIDVLDANGNYRNIGTVSTDSSGVYTFSWLPDISGDYKVFARFEGTDGYWPSYAESGFTVDDAASATTTPSVNTVGLATTADLLMYMAAGVIAIIIAIAIVGILILRKP